MTRSSVFGADDLFMVCAAFRYALGRRSYAPGLVMRWLKDHASELTDDLRKQIAKEVREWDRLKQFADDREYRRDWLRFADAIEAFPASPALKDAK